MSHFKYNHPKHITHWIGKPFFIIHLEINNLKINRRPYSIADLFLIETR
jgi:hypothetical protein